MKTKVILLALLLIGSSNLVTFAEEGTSQTPNACREAWKSMTPEQRQAKKAEWRQKFQNMTPEERQAFKEKRRARFESLPPEKQQAIRARMEQRRAKWKQNKSDGTTP